MRNLKIIGRSLLHLSSKDALPLTATNWDTSSNALICAFGPTESRATIELKRLHYIRGDTEERLETIASWDAPCPLPSLAHDSILSLHHFSDTSTTCLVLAGGDIIIVREHALPTEQPVEIVGSVDAGIAAATWSPDEELLTIVTQADTILLMTRDIDNIASITLTSEDVNVSNHVSVGWGKKETQFKGKRARALQDPTVPETVDTGVLSSIDDGSVTISWRGDGAYFAVSKVEESQRRMIRVYSREGHLDAVSEPVDGLEGALSWRPSGNLIASTRRSSDKLEVVFFERNGLRHGQFDLRVTQAELDALEKPLALQWNNDSNVLAVSYSHKVQLWTMSNYHYYLKQELVFPDPVTQNVTCSWHSERPLSIALSNSDALQILELVSLVSSGSVTPPHDFGMVASIDGLSLKLTPLRIANIPPPMSLYTLVTEQPTVDVALSRSGDRLAVLSHHNLTLYTIDVTKRPMPKPTVIWCNEVLRGQSPRQVVFGGNDQVYVLTDAWDETESHLWASTKEELLLQGPALSALSTSRLTSDLGYNTLFLQSQDGALHQVKPSQAGANSLSGSDAICKFLSFSIEVQIVSFQGQVLAFGLSSTGKLFANERELIRNCTSFVVTETHLIVTTTQHLLKFIELAQMDDLQIPADDVQNDERSRSIERGAKIVTVIPTTYSVVLQMPRGNLETIYPRALVLAAIRRNVETKRYDEAFMICRSQRVDMNILHDHDPSQFITSVEQIITQIKKKEYLDLLISQFRNEDVSQTMYKEMTSARHLDTNRIQTPGDIELKVNLICDAFLAVLEQPKYRDEHLQNIITSHVSKRPPDLETALEMVAQLQESRSELADKAAEHICFLADVNVLYDTSLGLYDLELALMIAQQSQKDPREYLPHLQSLENMTPLRRKFSIDDQLGRRAKALGHLKTLEVFDEAQEYVEKHALYTEALRLYQYDTARQKEIMLIYAGYLSANNNHKEAALAYESLGNHAAAWPCYRSANLWREALASAMLSEVSPSELNNIASSLADGLVEAKDYLSASTITLDYLSDIPSTARLLCRGCHFAEAVRIISLRSQRHLIAEVVDPCLVEKSADMTEFLADMKSQLAAQIPRLNELRTKKAEDPMAFYEGMDDGGANIPDNISLAPTDTTSGGTFMTRYTNQTGTVNTQTTRKTSKNKRREERKRARGKKGTVYEEEYLINSIERLIERLNSMQDEIQRLVEGLVKRDMRERAVAVSNAANAVVDKCQDAVREMWPSPSVAGNAQMGGGEGERLGQGPLDVDGQVTRPVGGDATFWDSVQEVGRKREAPVVAKFATLALLDGF